MNLRYALIGNPNCGKTTLFNYLTGSRAHIGNWPGVTVERREGVCRLGEEEVYIVDLPGIYSLSPYSAEEIISRNYIIEQKPDLIINIVDATNLERNLYLTSQLIEMDIPIIIVLNMIDEIYARGDMIKIDRLEMILGIVVIPISASRGEGIDVLMAEASRASKSGGICRPLLSDTAVFSYAQKIRKAAAKDGCSLSLFSAVKLMEGDINIQALNLASETVDYINFLIVSGEKKIRRDWEITIADLRYKKIKIVVDSCTEWAERSNGISDKIDKIVTNRFLAIPIFIMIMTLIFQITFGRFGTALSDCMDFFVSTVVSTAVRQLLNVCSAGELLTGLAADGIVSGVGMVFIFLPQILILFLFLSILEDCGYMARAAFIMDKPLRCFGLSGKTFVPLLMGFGCSVPAIMAARTLENEDDRRLAIILTPFMSCGARLPIYTMFAGTFFAENQAMVVVSLYLLGVAAALLSGILLRPIVSKGKSRDFIMELPPYRLPSAKTVVLHVWERVCEFIKKAFSILLTASIIIWFMQNFDFRLKPLTGNENSMLGLIGQAVSPFFKPLGFGSWKISAALLTGFAAKETVVSTLGILYNNTGSNISSLRAELTPLSAYSCMVFALLYMPCAAAVAAIHKEMNSWKWTFFAIAYQTAVAWASAFIIYQFGSFFIENILVS